MKKILTVVGARPQFIKCAAVSDLLRNEFVEVLVHTGQHYDNNMSGIFFSQLGIPEPDYNLGIGSGSHAFQIGSMLIKMEKVIINEKPDAVIVYGDTNSTIAGAMAGSRLDIPVFHIEAGLRSYNMKMPEEQNRIVTDRLSTLLFCPTNQAVDNLKKENVTKGVFNVGDVMYDSTILNICKAERTSTILSQLGIISNEYIIATIHRAENTDCIGRLENIIRALNESDLYVVLPIHPRTKKVIVDNKIKISAKIKVVEPIGYLDMLMLLKNACKVVTDSGGIQKEAYFLGTPCIVVRDETEWVELVKIGANILVGSQTDRIIECIKTFKGNVLEEDRNIFGDGKSSEKILSIIKKYI